MSPDRTGPPPPWKTALILLTGAGICVAGYFLAVDRGQRGNVSRGTAQLLFFAGAAAAAITVALIMTTYIRRHRDDDPATRRRAIQRNQLLLGPLAVLGGVIGELADGTIGTLILGICAGTFAYFEVRAIHALIQTRRRHVA